MICKRSAKRIKMLFQNNTLISGQISKNKTTNHNTDNKVNKLVTFFAFLPAMQAGATAPE